MAEEDDPNVARRVLRTVTPAPRNRPDSEMTVIGLAYFAGLVILLVPLLPFIVIIWLAAKLLEAVRGG